MGKEKKPENIHFAVSPEDCARMGQLNGWNLKAVKPSGDRILKAKCIFDGQQTSFEDTRYESDN